MRLYKSLGLFIAASVALTVSNVTMATAKDNKSEEEIFRALKKKKTTRTRSFSAQPQGMGPRSRSFIRSLKGKRTRQITVEERKELVSIIEKEELPGIDLTILFEYDSTQVTRASEPTLIRLGQALKRRELHGSTILIAGHTDAKGSDDYNLDLSKRRAEAIKDYLHRYFGLDADKLITVGFGEEKLNPGLRDPYSSGHRRVQITNLTQ